MSAEHDAVTNAVQRMLDATPDPSQSESLELEQAIEAIAAMVSARQPYLASLEDAVRECGGFPKGDAELRSMVSQIAEREAQWMAMLQAIRHKAQQQIQSRQRLRQLGSRARSVSMEPVGKTRAVG